MGDGFPVFGGDDPYTQSGWICDPISCRCVSIDGAGAGIYSSEAECNKNCCPPPKNPGWNCVDTHSVDITNRYVCEYNGTQGQYKTKEDCEFRCGPGSVTRGTVPTRPTTPVPTPINRPTTPPTPRTSAPYYRSAEQYIPASLRDPSTYR
jgi:hypothetical protein